jgi:hypothetical protein
MPKKAYGPLSNDGGRASRVDDRIAAKGAACLRCCSPFQGSIRPGGPSGPLSCHSVSAYVYMMGSMQAHAAAKENQGNGSLAG